MKVRYSQELFEALLQYTKCIFDYTAGSGQFPIKQPLLHRAMAIWELSIWCDELGKKGVPLVP
jgi:hypothetical protein